MYYILAMTWPVAFLLWLLYRAYARTITVVLDRPEYHPRRQPPSQPLIYLFWHSKIFMPLPHCRSTKLGLVTLLDWKNRVYDRICRLYGYRTVPVRSSVHATAHLKQLLDNGCHIALAADGPHGPRGIPKPGALYLAAKSGRPIVPVRVECQRSWRLRWRWDRFEIPRPFSTVYAYVADPIRAQGQSLKEWRRQIRQALGEP